MENKIYDIAKKQSTGLELNTQEKEVLASFLKNEENVSNYNSLTFILNQTQPETIDLNIDVDSEWDQFKRLKANTKSKRIRRLSYSLSGIAATIAILISIVLFSTQQQPIVYSSNNQVQHFTLPDNSTVILNKNSTLTLSKKFNNKVRSTILEGEAYFQIAKNKEKPFVIGLNNGLSVEVLGTSFNLRSFEGENNTDLHVLEGKVAFGFKNKKPEVIVEKGKQVRFSANSNSFESKPLNNTHITKWQSGHFKFDNTPLSHLIESFEHYYNKQIDYPNNKNDLKYSGQFSQPQESDFAKVLSLAFGWNYKITDKKIIFSEKE